VGWVRDRELHIRLAHGLKAGAATPILFPGIGDGLPKRAEPFFSYRRQQRLLIGEMPVECAAGNPQALAHGPQRQMLDAVRLDGAQGLIQKGAAQVPVVVGLGGLLSRSRMCRTSHTKEF
jgi:hypothetical protein